MTEQHAMKERTLAILKPDAVQRNIIGEIITMMEKAGLRIVAMKRLLLTQKDAEGFYAVHRDKSFFPELTAYMASGPVVVAVLEGKNAIARYRELMGATNPADAAPGTIRNIFAASIEANSVHGSDAPETARQEIAYFFSALEID